LKIFSREFASEKVVCFVAVQADIGL